jgi:hypothetical protein
VLVLGGQAGGIDGETYAEVWWLDLAARPDGVWHELTGRVTHMDQLGQRREGACAYDPQTTIFCSWMGRASKEIPDGAKRSAGAWRISLANLTRPDAELTWERLAPDDLDLIPGRHQIPSVWDPVHQRMLVIGGRSELDEFTDVWAIYPGLTAAACAEVDPYAGFSRGSDYHSP